jgi:hypothetical protein
VISGGRGSYGSLERALQDRAARRDRSSVPPLEMKVSAEAQADA